MKFRRCLRAGCAAHELEGCSGYIGGILVSWWLCATHAAEYPPSGGKW